MRKPRHRKRNNRGVQIILLFLAIGVSLVLSLQLWTLSAQKIRELRSSRTDNVVWTLGQLEVEYLQLLLSLKSLGQGDIDVATAADQVRRRFDVYYSRVETLRVSPLYRAALLATGSLNIIETLRDQNDRLAPLIDAQDSDLISQAPELSKEFAAAAKSIRHVATRGNVVGATHGEQAREEVGIIMLRLSIVTALLMVLLATLAGLFFRLSQQNAKRASEHRATSVRLSEVLGTTPDALIVTDGRGRIIEFNQAAADLLKIDRGAALGKRLREYLLDRNGEEIALPFVTTGRITGQELDLRVADGSHVPVEVSEGVTEIETDKFHVYFLRDISERRHSEVALMKSRDKALAGQRAKSRFLAVMSHEMRTPLNGILGIVDLLRDGGHRGNKQIEHYLELLQQSGQTLLNHVNDVLDIAQLEAAGITLTQAPFDLDALLQRVIAPMEVAASARNNRLQLETHPDQLGYVIGDEKRLHQVFLNLIGNAIKFTENGDICVTVSTRSGKDDGKVRLEVQVQDTGIGVAEEEQGRIFDDFVRIDDTSRSRHEGTGLGLGIARRIVTAMGGKIGVDSIPGDGSVFWFHVDLTPTDSLQTAEADAEERTQEPKKPLSILIVEDIETNRFVLREMLERDGYKVTEAVNGQEGVDAAHDTRFDLILMDISMPVMGGVEATRLIRKNGASRDSRIVAVTAHVFNQDTALFREAGMDAVVAKPITRQNMRAVLSGEGRIEPDRPGTDLIDISHLSQVLRKLGRQKVDDLISGFRTEAPELIELLEATDWHDASDIGDRVHALAGVAAMIGARQFRNMLSRLESSLTADNPQDLSGWAALLATLWGETEQALNDYLTSQG